MAGVQSGPIKLHQEPTDARRLGFLKLSGSIKSQLTRVMPVKLVVMVQRSTN